MTHRGSVMLATAAFAPDGKERIVDPDRWTDLPINIYAEGRFEAAAACAGMRMQRLGHVFQDWFVVYRLGNDAARRAAQAMRGVDWRGITPAWEDPGWPRELVDGK